MNHVRFVLPLVFVFFGCSTTQKSPTHVLEVGVDVRNDIAVIEPKSGDEFDWAWLLGQIAEADIVLLGEQHDHVVGHAVQLAVIEDSLDVFPKSVVAFEMLERDEQSRVDDYMDGVIDAAAFATLTHSTNWAGQDTWSAWYQPIIDATKCRGGSVIAANAPRRYVKLARTGGFERIDLLPQTRRELVDYPKKLSSGRYRERFWELADHGEEGEEKAEIEVDTIDDDDPLLPMFRSQQTWDATMAQSIASVMESGEFKKTFLIVGQFHVEYDGGVVQELRKRAPDSKVFSISIQRHLPEEEWQGKPPIADAMVVENLNK